MYERSCTRKSCSVLTTAVTENHVMYSILQKPVGTNYKSNPFFYREYGSCRFQSRSALLISFKSLTIIDEPKPVNHEKY